MDEQEFLASDDPAAVLHCLVGSTQGHVYVVSGRKLELLLEAWRSNLCGDERWCMGSLSQGPRLHKELHSEAINITTKYRPVAAALLRDIVGNIFRPMTLPYRLDKLDDSGWSGLQRVVNAPWLTSQVLALARTAYEERGRACPACKGTKGWFYKPGLVILACDTCKGTGTADGGTLDPFRLALVADALEEAGCTSEELLMHLRGRQPYHECALCAAKPGMSVLCETCLRNRAAGWQLLQAPHVRGYWALDLILGKE